MANEDGDEAKAETNVGAEEDGDAAKIEEDAKARTKKEKRRKRLLQEISTAEKRGVCYLSRIPPHLKPLKLRHLLSQFGDILRIYLSPEDPAARMRRKTSGRNTGKNFTEGWVEFANKSVAKRVAKMLNGEPMGGKRRSAYFYDLWNIKYLRKFKWDHLTEEVAYRNAVREQKMAADISAAKRERDFYLARVDQSKAISAMEERKNKKHKQDQHLVPTSGADDNGSHAKLPKVVRHFPQKKPVPGNADGGSAGPRLSRDILAAVLGKGNVNGNG